MNIKYKLISAFFRRKSKIECHNILLLTNSYYKNLSENNKDIFRIRTLMFLNTTNFSSDPGFLLTNRMKIIISSAFVQITFGLKILTLDEFKHIFITPSSYSYKNNKALFDGDVNIYTKRVNMSWPAIKKGFEINDDAINLAIHEFGHCLIYENTKRSYISRIFQEKEFNIWRKLAKAKAFKIKSKENKILRDYAGNNMSELFSVSLETFFEQPEKFRNHESKLYFCMTRLLKQDPRNKINPIQK